MLNDALPSLPPFKPSMLSILPTASAAFNSFMLFKFILTGLGDSGKLNVPFIISVK
ncbi:hypothetical protein [Treponema sp. OMZ 788]|uniref:hypothetical protein n=1 Tax=Treponema sp. OMZ 788 TaxID=2563664 RepID=UPI0020A3A0FE|nr:hypothetical protein [Treponema sp. OMZ 788]